MKLIIYILFPIYMSKELNDFKQMRITALKNQYSIDLNSLNRIYARNVNIVNRSRLILKKNDIQSLVFKYNTITF